MKPEREQAIVISRERKKKLNKIHIHDSKLLPIFFINLVLKLRQLETMGAVSTMKHFARRLYFPSIRQMSKQYEVPAVDLTNSITLSIGWVIVWSAPVSF